MRKNVFSYNAENLKDGSIVRMDGFRFVTNQISTEQQEKVDEGFVMAEEIQKRYRLPWYLDFLKFASGMMSLGLVLFFVMEMIRNTIALEGSTLLRYTVFTITAVAIFLLLRWYERYQIMQFDQEFTDSEEKETMDSITKQSFEELGIPDDAIQVELLMSSYKVKDDMRKQSRIAGFFEYANYVFFVFQKEDHICFSSMEEVYEIPKAAFTTIVKVEKRTTLPTWGKVESIKSEKYKPYKISTSAFGINIRNRYEVHIDIDGEEYMLVVPEYDIDVFCEATGLQVEK